MTEIVKCCVCSSEFDAHSDDLGTYFCQICFKAGLNKKYVGVDYANGPDWTAKKIVKPLDKVFETIMPFGKFKGKPFYLVPDVYLEWLELELLTKQNDPDLLRKITAELKRRAANPKARI